ncbi:MAG: CHAT domain-containing protein [Planctomyces sp.]
MELESVLKVGCQFSELLGGQGCFTASARFLQILLTSIPDPASNRARACEALTLLCTMAHEADESPLALSVLQRLQILPLDQLEQHRDQIAIVALVNSSLSGLVSEAAIEMLTAVAQTLVDCRGAKLATALLLASVGLLPADLDGLHSIESKFRLLHSGSTQAMTEFFGSFLKSHFIGNPRFAARQLVMSELPCEIAALARKWFYAVKGSLAEVTRPDSLLKLDACSDDLRIHFCFTLASALQASGRPLPALSVTAGCLHRCGGVQTVPDSLRNAPPGVLFSQGLHQIWPTEFHQRLEHGLRLTAILQSRYGHQRALELLLDLLQIPRFIDAAVTSQQFQLALSRCSEHCPRLLPEVTLQLHQALQASFRHGSAAKLLEAFQQECSRSVSYLSPRNQRIADCLPQTGRPPECPETLLRRASSLWQQNVDGCERPPSSVLEGSPLYLVWDSVNGLEAEVRELQGSIKELAEIVYCVTAAGELLLSAGRNIEALQVTNLLLNRKLAPGNTADNRAADAFAAVFTAMVAENSLIPVLRFARVRATAVCAVDSNQNGALILEHFLASSQSIRKFPATWWLKELQPPQRFLHVTAWIRLAPVTDPDRLEICRRLVEQIRLLSEDELRFSIDRAAFWRQLQETRSVILNAALDQLRTRHQFEEIEELCLEITRCLEILDNRVLYETIVLQSVDQQRPSALDSPAGYHDDIAECTAPPTTPIQRDIAGGWQTILDASEEQVQSWLQEISDTLSASNNLCTAGTEQRYSEEDLTFQQATERLHELERQVDDQQLKPELWQELLGQISRPPDLKELLAGNTVLLRTVFDREGRLFWWVVHREETGSPRVIGYDISAAGVRDILAAACSDTDVRIEAVWVRLYQLQSMQASHSEQLFQNSAALDDWLWLVHQLDERATVGPPEENRRLSRCRSRWPRLTALLPAVSDNPGSGEMSDQKKRESWSKCKQILESQTPPDCWAAWKDQTLNAACTEQLQTVSQFINLSRCNIHPSQLADCSVLTNAEGPLLAVPLTWLPFHGAPLFTHARTAGVAISMQLQALARTAVAAPQPQSASVLCALWEHPKARRSMGIPLFWRGLHSLLHNDQKSISTRILALCDQPRATPVNLASCSTLHSPDLIVVAGHGFAARRGIQLAGNTGESAGELWRGNGDFKNCGLLVLLACSMGRLHQQSQTEVDGIYASILAHGGRSLIAPRWDVDDLFSAAFILEFLNSLPQDLRQISNSPCGPVFNNVRKAAWRRWLCSQPTPAPDKVCCHHTISAFEFFGW